MDIAELYRRQIRPHFSEPGAKNPYNPEGITLAAVKAGLRPFFDDELDFLFVDSVLTDLLREKSAPPRPPSSGEQARVRLGSDAHLIQAKDIDLANLIQKAPIAMIKQRDAASAVARWCYAVWHSRSKSARIHGQKMLGKISRRGKSPPKKSPYSDYAIAKAYDDLTLYCTGLARCIREAGKRMGFVRRYYPEQKELEKLGISISSMIGSHFTIPKPSNIAKMLLIGLTGLGRSALLERIKIGRHTHGPIIAHITDT